MITRASTSNPAKRSASQWSARKAVLKSRHLSDDDPDIVECDEALAYWRVRRAIDKDRHLLSSEHVPALADLLRHAHTAVPA